MSSTNNTLVKLSFSKYQGTGNDFIMLDNRERRYQAEDLPISALCNRRFGIGADGLIVLQHHPTLDFHMIYFNADGSQSFCGNGSRCAVRFAQKLGMFPSDTKSVGFLSTDGAHTAELLENEEINLHMHPISGVEQLDGDLVLNTGSPHYIRFVNQLDQLPVVEMAREIRYSEKYKMDGINVNFIQPSSSGFSIRTYERGVEDETLSCGTGVTAAALASHFKEGMNAGAFSIPVKAVGGDLWVHFVVENNQFNNIKLQGPAEFVFTGEIEI